MKFYHNNLIYIILSGTLFLLSSCSDGDETPSVEAPATYTFERDGASTVSFSGQTTRIAMGEEIISALKDNTMTAEALKAMYNHAEGDVDFSDSELNTSSKNARSKTAASSDFYSSNTAVAAEIKEEFDGWIDNQVTEVFPRWNETASAGMAGQIADGSSTRYVSAKGIEYNQIFNKAMIGALMADQIMNNYLSNTVLSAGTNEDDNNNGVLAEGKNYTTMEHKWDEAYGYLYGGSLNITDPRAEVGSADSFLNKYLGKVDGDADFTGISEDIFNAFKLGRAAIVAKNYTVRDQQAELIRGYISKIIAVRAVHYLQAAKSALNPGDMGTAFHDLSEGLGFVYSLQFTRIPGTDSPYFTRTEVEGFIDQVMAGQNGLWDVTAATLDGVSNEIADGFDFTVAQTND